MPTTYNEKQLAKFVSTMLEEVQRVAHTSVFKYQLNLLWYIIHAQNGLLYMTIENMTTIVDETRKEMAHEAK